jgi:hypothetical protein
VIAEKGLAEITKSDGGKGFIEITGSDGGKRVGRYYRE